MRVPAVPAADGRQLQPFFALHVSRENRGGAAVLWLAIVLLSGLCVALLLCLAITRLDKRAARR
jgi:hypothetical protein